MEFKTDQPLLMSNLLNWLQRITDTDKDLGLVIGNVLDLFFMSFFFFVVPGKKEFLLLTAQGHKSNRSSMRLITDRQTDAIKHIINLLRGW